MNIQGANTEPFYRFLRFQEEFGRNVKLAYGSIQVVNKTESDVQDDEGRHFISLPTGDEPWGKDTQWRGIERKRRIPQVTRFLSQMGVVVVTSAFEDFLIEVNAERSRYLDFFGSETPSGKPKEESREEGNALVNLYTSFGWKVDPIKYLLPLFDYFILARNCIVHRSGRASRAFVEHAESTLLRNSIDTWPSKLKKKLPELPQVREGHAIQFFPRHPIMFCEICLRAAKEVNSVLAHFLGLEGLVYMAAYHALLADDRVPTNARNSVERIINHMLTERCLVGVSDKYEVIQILKKLGIWEQCQASYKRLQESG